MGGEREPAVCSGMFSSFGKRARGGSHGSRLFEARLGGRGQGVGMVCGSPSRRTELRPFSRARWGPGRFQAGSWHSSTLWKAFSTQGCIGLGAASDALNASKLNGGSSLRLAKGYGSR